MGSGEEQLGGLKLDKEKFGSMEHGKGCLGGVPLDKERSGGF
jgi:hypothetical protein